MKSTHFSELTLTRAQASWIRVGEKQTLQLGDHGGKIRHLVEEAQRQTAAHEEGGAEIRTIQWVFRFAKARAWRERRGCNLGVTWCSGSLRLSR